MAYYMCTSCIFSLNTCPFDNFFFLFSMLLLTEIEEFAVYNFVFCVSENVPWCYDSYWNTFNYTLVLNAN